MKRFIHRFFFFALGVFLGVWAAAAIAHEGEDHGPPPMVNARPLLPRVTAHSELFEVVGVLEPGGRLLLWLDAAATNAPVAGAVVEVEGAGANGKAVEVSPGVYEIGLPKAPAPGSHPLTLTVQAGSDMDLLGAPLVVVAAQAAEASAGAQRAGADAARAAWVGPVVWAASGAGVMGAAIAVVLALRRRRALSVGR